MRISITSISEPNKNRFYLCHMVGFEKHTLRIYLISLIISCATMGLLSLIEPRRWLVSSYIIQAIVNTLLFSALLFMLMFPVYLVIQLIKRFKRFKVRVTILLWSLIDIQAKQ
jgi:hypothetical protein